MCYLMEWLANFLRKNDTRWIDEIDEKKRGKENINYSWIRP